MKRRGGGLVGCLAVCEQSRGERREGGVRKERIGGLGATDMLRYEYE
jgi:hypothetical protein